MRELDDETGIGLIEKRRQGFGKVNVIYVKTFMPEKTDEKKFEEELKKFKKQTSLENEESTEVYNSNFMKFQNQTSRSPENKLQEVYLSLIHIYRYCFEWMIMKNMKWYPVIEECMQHSLQDLRLFRQS